MPASVEEAFFSRYGQHYDAYAERFHKTGDHSASVCGPYRLVDYEPVAAGFCMQGQYSLVQHCDSVDRVVVNEPLQLIHSGALL